MRARSICHATCSRRRCYDWRLIFPNDLSSLLVILSERSSSLPQQHFTVMLMQGCVNVCFYDSLLQENHVLSHIPALWLWKRVNIRPPAALPSMLGSPLGLGSALPDILLHAGGLYLSAAERCASCMMSCVRGRGLWSCTVTARQSPTTDSLISSAHPPAFTRDPLLSLSC